MLLKLERQINRFRELSNQLLLFKVLLVSKYVSLYFAKCEGLEMKKKLTRKKKFNIYMNFDKKNKTAPNAR